MKVALIAFGPLGVIAAGVATTAAAVPRSGGSAAIVVAVVGLGLSFMVGAIPVVWKLRGMEATLNKADRDFRRAIFGGESEPGLVKQMRGILKTMYGPPDAQHKGMVIRLRDTEADLVKARKELVDAQKGLADMQLVLNEQERRMGALESPRARGDQSG